MSLMDYLEQKGGLQVFYRLEKMPQWLEPQITVENVNEKRMLAKQIIDVAYGKRKHKKLYVKRTKKINFLRYFRGKLVSGKLIDIAVVSLSTQKPRADKEFNKALKQSKQWKNKLISYLNKDLMPFFKELQASPDVSAIIQRGDLTQSDRYPNPLSDIDILIVTKFCQYNMEKKLKLLNSLKNSPGNVFVNYFVFDFQKGLLRKEFVNYFVFDFQKGLLRKEPLSISRGQPGVEYLIISFPSLQKMREKKVAKRFETHPYIFKNHLMANILYQKKDFGTKYLEMVMKSSVPKKKSD